MTQDDPYRILTPSEYKALLAVDKREKIHANFRMETMMNTGMRYTELHAFSAHPEWFSAKNHLIALPAKATKTRKGRDVHLTPAFSEKLELYLTSNKLKFPARNNMNKDLRIWSNGQTCSPIPKTFRKTWETYLIYAQANREKPGYTVMDVWASQGHTGAISMDHYYQSAGRLKSERDAVLELTKGWLT